MVPYGPLWSPMVLYGPICSSIVLYGPVITKFGVQNNDALKASTTLVKKMLKLPSGNTKNGLFPQKIIGYGLNPPKNEISLSDDEISKMKRKDFKKMVTEKVQLLAA